MKIVTDPKNPLDSQLSAAHIASMFGKRIKPTADQGRHQCEAGYCQARACVDFGRYVGPVGWQVRYLCCKHAAGKKGHLEVHPIAVTA